MAGSTTVISTQQKLSVLQRPVQSLTQRVGMITLRGYLIMATVTMLVKVVSLAVGH